MGSASASGRCAVWHPGGAWRERQKWPSGPHEHPCGLSLRPQPSHSLRLHAPTQSPFSTRLRSGSLFSFVACFPDSVASPCRSCAPASWPLLPTTTTHPTELFDFPFKVSPPRLSTPPELP